MPYADIYDELEIRILEQQDDRYPIELTLNNERQFPRGYADPVDLPNMANEDALDVGERLFRWLLTDEKLQAAWTEIRSIATQCRIRMRIDAAAPQLHALPWELLREVREGHVPLDLAASTTTPFSRYFAGTWQPGTPIHRPPIRILVVISTPNNLSEYGVQTFDDQQEWAILEKATSNLEVVLIRLSVPCTLLALETELKKGYHILHFVGHGGFSVDQGAVVLMADVQNQVVMVSDAEFAAMLVRQREMPGNRPKDGLRLIYLDSCQTATRDTADAFRGFAPQLVKAGVPAVIAMQNRIEVKTAQQFSQVFYSRLLTHGIVDLACNEARSALLTTRSSGAAIPALFMRLRSARLWYRAGFSADEDSMWRALLLNLLNKSCTPILGPDFGSYIFGSRREMAQSWAKAYRFPLSMQDSVSLARVSQYMAVQQGTQFPRNELIAHLRKEILQQYEAQIPAESRSASLDELIVLAGRIHREGPTVDPYTAVAQLPFSLYVTASPSSLLAEALKAAGKTPVIELCRWHRQLETVPSVLAQQPDYEPDVKHPLIYHLFGNLQTPTSVVLTEDDYLDYLIGVTNNKELIPTIIRGALADSALLFLGFRMEEWEFRVLFRSIVSREGGFLLDQYQHIAVQINPDESQIQDIERARRYLSSYFDKSRIHIYWGSVEDFIVELWRRWQKNEL